MIKSVSALAGASVLCGCAAKVYEPAAQADANSALPSLVEERKGKTVSQDFDSFWIVAFTERGLFQGFRRERLSDGSLGEWYAIGGSDQAAINSAFGKGRFPAVLDALSSIDSGAQVYVVGGGLAEQRWTIETTAFTPNAPERALELANETCGLPDDAPASATDLRFEYPYFFGLKYFSFECSEPGKDAA